MASPKITAISQRKIETLLRRWKGKLTWEKLVRYVELELELITTRQTLCSYVGIAVEYKNRKAQLRGAKPEIYTELATSEINAFSQIKNLKAQNEILEKKNAEQLRLIERIFMNASNMPNIDLMLLVKERPEEK